MAETETRPEARMRDIFDLFASDPDSVLTGMMSAHARQSGKISRVTFNAALRAIADNLGGETNVVYRALNAYLLAWKPIVTKAKGSLTNPTLLRAIFLLFPRVAQRVSDRHGEVYTEERFLEILAPFFSRVPKSKLRSPGQSSVTLYESFVRYLETGFAIGKSQGG